MPLSKITQDYPVFSFLGLGWLGWLWFGLGLTLGGVFYSSLLALGGIALANGAIIAWKRGWLGPISRELGSVLLFSVILIACFSFFVVPTIFSGRDQGSYSLAALRLAQEHHITFSTPASQAFFDIYGPGKALNFPGFFYTASGELTPQFPLGYITWLASFFAFFGTFGLILANGLTLALAFLSLYLLLRLFVPKSFAWWGLLLAATSFSFVWFFKFTLSENLAWALFLFLALQLTLLFREGRTLYYVSALVTAGFFAFTRIEGWLFLVITLILLAFSPAAKQLWQSRFKASVLVPAFLFGIVTSAVLILNFPFYKTVGKALLQTWQPGGEASTPLLADAFSSLLFLGQSLWAYGLLVGLVIGAFSVALLLKRRQYLALIPFVLALPTLLYFVQPHISGDHPWMLRRFAFSLWPTFLFLAILGIHEADTFLKRRYPHLPFFQKGAYAALLLSILLILQLPAFFRYAFITEHRGLLEETQALIEPFGPNDLVLVSRLATGDAWAMFPDTINALTHKNAVYFFNPEDLAKLDLTRFDNTYLIASADEVPFYLQHLSHQLSLVKPYVIVTDQLTEHSPENTSFTFPDLTATHVSGSIFKIHP
jgi:hypothetical protein